MNGKIMAGTRGAGLWNAPRIVGLWLAALAALGGLGAGCGDKGQNAVRIGKLPNGGTVTTTGEPDSTNTLLRARAVGANLDQVHASAQAALEEKLLGAEYSWLFEYSGIPAWAPAVDLRMREEHEDGDLIITLGLSRERVVEILDALGAYPWRADVPEALDAVLSRAVQATVASVVCQRRQELLDDQSCTPPDQEVVRGTVASLAASVRVRSFYQGGQPIGADMTILPAFSVMVELHTRNEWRPLAGVPVVASAPDWAEPLRAVSDDTGLISFTQDGASLAWPEGGVSVAVDREGLLGPFAGLWPENVVAIPGRVVERGRFTMIDVVHVRGKDASDDVFAAAVAKAAERIDGATLVPIKKFARDELARADDARLATQLPGYAVAWQGRIDKVVRVNVESDYASRMGAHRIWYEARAKVAVYDAWTGEKITAFEETATASGVGEERADEAARELLAERVVQRLLADR